jgi:hypothetical protein
MNFMPSFVKRMLKANSCKRWRESIKKGLSQGGGGTDFFENLGTSLLNKELLNETTFSQIHLAGQWL